MELTQFAQFSASFRPEEAANATTLLGVVLRRGLPPPLVLRAKNTGTAAMTITCTKSANNNYGTAPEAHAAMQVSLAGTNVASVSVVPGGEVVFAILDSSKDYIAIHAATADLRVGAAGVVEVQSTFGEIATRQAIGVP